MWILFLLIMARVVVIVLVVRLLGIIAVIIVADLSFVRSQGVVLNDLSLFAQIVQIGIVAANDRGGLGSETCKAQKLLLL